MEETHFMEVADQLKEMIKGKRLFFQFEEKGEKNAIFLPHRFFAGASSSQQLLEQVGEVSRQGDWVCFHAESALQQVWVFRKPLLADQQLTELTLQAYKQLLELVEQSKLQLARVWNFIPQIHSEEAGLENYRLFNLGRSRAFEQNYGTLGHQKMPAATGIGTPENELIICVLLTENGVEHLENPQQIPAWKYPAMYGPQPPSFARASLAVDKKTAWLAGTAAVLGHESVGQTLAEQLALTWENIRIMEQQFPADLRALDFTAWVRFGADAELVEKSLQQQLPKGCNWRVVEAEICRKELLVEIEGVYGCG